VAAGSGLALAQDPSGDDEAAVRALLEQFYQAYAREDLAAIHNFWSANVPGLERLMAEFAPTLAGKDFSFANVVVSRIEVKAIVASARVTLDATIVDTDTQTAQTGKWARNFSCVKDPEGWRVWRDAPAVDDVAGEIRRAASATDAAAVVEREPGLPAGEITQALFGLGNRFRVSGRPEDAREAYRLSEQVAERSGDSVVIGQSLTNVGVTSQIGGDYDRALESFEKALALFEQTGDRARIAGAEANVGSTLYLKQRYPEAIRRFRKALEYYEAVDFKAAMASTLHSIGNAQYLANDFGAALDSYRRSLALREAIPGAELGEAHVLQAIGLVQKEQGDYDGALESYTASFTRHEKGGNKAGMGVVLSNLGDVHRLVGGYPPALECYFKSLPLLEEVRDQETLASTLADIASVYAAERRYPQALDYFARSLPVFEKTGNTSEIARVVAGSGAVHFAQGKYAQAIEEYQRSLGLFEKIKSKAGIAWTLAHLGLVHQAENRFAEAQDAYEKGLAIIEELNDRPSIAITLALLARARAALDRPHEALAVAGRAAVVAAESGGLDTLARARLVAGEISRHLEDDAQARQAFADAAAALEQLQAEGTGAERDRFFGDTLAPYLGLVGLSIEAGRPEEALTWLERGKACLLRNVIGGTGTIVTKGMTDSEKDLERKLGRRLVSLTTQVRREAGRQAPDQARLGQLQADLEQVRAERVAFTTALYEAHPNLKALRVQTDPLAIDATLGLPLLASGAVVEFAVSDAKTFLFVIRPIRPSQAGTKTPAASAGRGSPTAVGRGFPALPALSVAEGSEVEGSPATTGDAAPGVSVTVHVVDVKAADLAARIAQFRALIMKKDAGAHAAARDLYDLVLKPAEADLAGATRVVLVPDAVLWALPFQALQPRDGRYLIEDRAVSYAPSLGAFIEMARGGDRERGAPGALPTLAAFGVSSLRPASVARLAHVRPDVKIDPQPEAPREATAVAALYGATRGKA
ncbi:MAG: tetratricopeptide repeat protein, partial [Acidobacteria bacterium]|nr:tetratricopeptide repeat protein [Acidobacteriota bacterium]